MALDTNLTAYYKFDNGAVTADSVASFTLTNTGTVASTASGKIGYGADFGNPNTTKWLTQTGFTFNSYPISISGWFYPNVVNDNGNLFSLGESTTNYYQIKLRNTDSHIVFRSNNATDAADVDTGVVASTNTWYHVVVVFNSTTNVDIYVNGTATNTGATVFVASSLSKFAIGALARGTPIQPYSGIADEVGWWTRAITSGEVTTLYNSGTGLQYPFITAITFAISETLALTESISNLRTRLFSTSETITLTETISVLKGIAFTVAEALGLVETFTSTRTRLFTVAESLGLVEVMARIKLLWTNSTKETTTWTDQSKNSTNWTNQTKA